MTSDLPELITKLKELDCSFVAMERILELPIGIISKWESGEVKVKAEDIVLLRVIITFPWLLNVAEDGFTHDAARERLLIAVKESLIKGTSKEATKDRLINCSFCDKSPEMVDFMIAGPGVNICNDCVRIANTVILDNYGILKKERFNEDKFYAGIREEILG